MVLEEFIREWENDCPTVTVRTSGSTGVPKEMAVEKARMAASAEVTCDFLGLKEGDRALLCLPVDYIAGKMMVVRSKVMGLDLVSVEPSGHPLAGVSASERFDLCAMVPMQVYNSLQSPEETAKLKNIRHLIIGGGAIDGSLAEKLRSFPNNVWSTYGMTETLSHIALRRLNGDDASEWYTPFNGVAVWTNADGCLVIDAPRVCAEVLTTNDIAETEKDDSGRVVRFRIKGRKDNVICSGGVKIQIEEAERMLKDKLSLPFLITKKKDHILGEKVVLLTEDDNLEGVEEKCKSVMPKYWLPRLYIHVDAVPETETGKPARAEAVMIAERFTEP